LRNKESFIRKLDMQQSFGSEMAWQLQVS